MVVLTLNAHKGLSPLRRRPVLPALRDALRAEGPDLVLLQEVMGPPDGGDAASQCAFLADESWREIAYGHTATNATGPFGNGLLSRFPIVGRDRVTISDGRGEHRAALHCVVAVPGTAGVHVVSVHLGLTGRQRRAQVERLCARVLARVPASAPLIVAGDFNDWRGTTHHAMTERTGTQDAFATLHGQPARTFPSPLPVLPLDRVYLRHLRPVRAHVRSGAPWSRLSDHAPLVVEVEP
jgi:endonuclease/exonuclease/phosphatase family metal-dependent hydrolase